MITWEHIAAQEALFARAFAMGDPTIARPLYDPGVVYVSPTVRLFGWQREIEGVERTLEFIALTIRRCTAIRYVAIETALVPDRDAAFVCIEFDWTVDERRLRSRYVVRYEYRDGRIARQELYYDPSAPPVDVGPGA